MGNTLEQHRAAIGGNTARLLSRGWSPSAGLFKPLTSTDQKRKKPQGKAKTTTNLVVEVILLGLMFSLLQRINGYVLCDHGSLQMAGSVDSEVMVQRHCFHAGMKELLKGCWGPKLTERCTSSYFSANFKPSMPGKKLIWNHLEDKQHDPRLQVSSINS